MSRHDHHYILRGKQVVVATLMEWARWFETADRHVAQDTIGDYWVSTVFLGLDHNYGSGPPILFETMVFDRGHPKTVTLVDGRTRTYAPAVDGYFGRYRTYEEAEKGHAKIVRAIRAKARGIRRVK